MAIETLEKEIDGVTYVVNQLPAKPALKVFDKLVGALGTALSSTTGLDAAALASFAQGSDAKLPIAALAALGKAVASLKLSDVEYVRDEFARVTFVRMGGEKDPQLSSILDLHFAGKLSSMFKWLGFCVECNYGDFLDGIRTQLRDSAQRAKPAAQTATAS